MENPRIEELRRRVVRDPASIAFAQLADEYRRLGRYDEAVATCRAGLEQHPNYLSAWVTLGRALLARGELDEAQAALDHVLRAAPDNLAALRARAELHGRRGEPSSSDKALTELEAWLAAILADRAMRHGLSSTNDSRSPVA